MLRPALHPILLAAALAAAGCAHRGPAAEPPTPGVQKVTVGQELGAAVKNQLQITFASGSDRLTPEGDKQLDIAARLFRDVRPVSMYSVGYSDAAGQEYANLILSARRANAVKTGLVARGIPANQVLLRAFGQSDPIDRAHPDAPANRRVVITWDVM